MAFWDDIKSIGSSAVNNIVSSAKKQLQTSADKASSALVPGLVTDVQKGFDSIFRQVKARVVDAAGKTQFAQEVRQNEIAKMTPQVIAAAAGVFVLGLVLAWVIFRRA